MTTTLADVEPSRRLGAAGQGMTGNVVLLDADTVTDVAGVNRLPPVDADGRPVGLLTSDAVAGALARRLQGQPAPVHGSRMEPD